MSRIGQVLGMPWAKAWKWGCMVYLQRTVGNFSVAAMLGVGRKLTKDMLN